MEEFYINAITFISNLDWIVKLLVTGILGMLTLFSIISIVKTHINPKKKIFKFGQFFTLAILITITVFFAIHAF